MLMKHNVDAGEGSSADRGVAPRWTPVEHFVEMPVEHRVAACAGPRGSEWSIAWHAAEHSVDAMEHAQISREAGKKGSTTWTQCSKCWT